MKRMWAYVFLACALLLCGCADKLSVPVRIEMNLVDLYPTKAIVQVAPGSEDAWYGLTVVAAESARTPEERETLADEYIAFQAGQYAALGKSEASFANRYFYRGTSVHRIKYLSNGADFVLLAFQLNPATNKRVGEVYSIEFSTPDYKWHPDLSFQVDFSGDSVFIVPSDPDASYYWDYELTDIIEKNYLGHNIYLYELTDMYLQYGFMESMLSVGPDEWEFSANDTSMMEGGRYSLNVVGMNAQGEFTSEITTIPFIYRKGSVCRE